MIKHIVILTLFFLIAFVSIAQDSLTKNTFVSIEILQKIPFSFADKGYFSEIARSSNYTIEPEIVFQRKSLLFPIIVGISSMKTIAYERLDYVNKGIYLKSGISFQLNYYRNYNKLNHAIVGINFIASNYKESGEVTFRGNYFESNTSTITQTNWALGMETFFRYKKIFNNNLFIVFTPKIALTFNDYGSSEFLAYNAPGFGYRADKLIDPNVSLNGSIKIGYKF